MVVCAGGSGARYAGRAWQILLATSWNDVVFKN